MKVLIIETGQIEFLQLVANGCNYIKDFLSNFDAFGNKPHQFKLVDGTDIYVASHETYDWWEKASAAQQALDNRIEELKAEHGADAVYSALSSVHEIDLMDEIAAFQLALDDAFGEAV